MACKGRWEKEDQERQRDLTKGAEQGRASSEITVLVMIMQSESVACLPWPGTIPSLSMH